MQNTNLYLFILRKCTSPINLVIMPSFHAPHVNLFCVLKRKKIFCLPLQIWLVVRQPEADKNTYSSMMQASKIHLLCKVGATKSV